MRTYIYYALLIVGLFAGFGYTVERIRQTHIEMYPFVFNKDGDFRVRAELHPCPCDAHLNEIDNSEYPY